MAIVKCTKCKKLYEYFRLGDYNNPYKCESCKKKEMRGINILFLVIIFSCLFLIPLTGAQSIFKQGDNLDIKVQCIENGTFCSNSAACNITLTDPDNSLILSNQPMTNQYSTYNYTLTNTTNIILDRTYPCSVTCCDSGLCASNTDCSFMVTANGKTPATAGIVVTFIIAFIIILFFLAYMIIHMIGHVFTLDYDILDMAFSLGGYFSLLGLEFLERYYLGNPDLRAWFLLFIQIGLYTHVILPLMSFAFVLTVGQFIKKKIWMKGREE